MASKRKDGRRDRRWMRYIDQTSRSSVQHYDYPFGLSIKVTPGYYAPRRVMRYRGRSWYITKRLTEEMFR